jgi:hypothetical protein
VRAGGGAGRERGGAARARAGAAEVFRPQERQRGLTPRSGSAEHQRGSAARNRYTLFPFCVFLLCFPAVCLVRLLTNEIALVCLLTSEMLVLHFAISVLLLLLTFFFPSVFLFFSL